MRHESSHREPKRQGTIPESRLDLGCKGASYEEMKVLIAAAAMLVSATALGSAAPDRFVCVGRHSVGLHYDSAKGWMPSIFAPAKYILRELRLDDQDVKKQKFAPLLSSFPTASWAFFETGVKQPQPIAACKFDNKTSFNCQSISARADFDPKTRRFQIVRSQGYMRQQQFSRAVSSPANKHAGDPDQPDDIFIEIGDCKAL